MRCFLEKSLKNSYCSHISNKLQSANCQHGIDVYHGCPFKTDLFKQTMFITDQFVVSFERDLFFFTILTLLTT